VRVGDENWQGFGVFRSSRLTDAVSPENPLGHDPLFHRVPSLNLPQPSLTICSLKLKMTSLWATTIDVNAMRGYYQLP